MNLHSPQSNHCNDQGFPWFSPPYKLDERPSRTTKPRSSIMKSVHPQLFGILDPPFWGDSFLGSVYRIENNFNVYHWFESSKKTFRQWNWTIPELENNRHGIPTMTLEIFHVTQGQQLPGPRSRIPSYFEHAKTKNGNPNMSSVHLNVTSWNRIQYIVWCWWG